MPPSRRPPTSRADAGRIGGPKVARSLPGGKRQDRRELSMPPGCAISLQIRQVAARRKLSLPTLEHERPRAITWRRPTYRMVLSMVRSPFYAGAYAFGRRESRTRVVNGRATRTSGHHKPMARWTALIRDHHPGYISWEQFERNQRLLEENTHMKGTMTRKAGRGGQCLLAGLLRCARCGRMLHVMYGRRGYARYECR